MVEWVERLGCGAESRRKVVSSKLGVANFMSTQQLMGVFFELGKDQAA